MAKGDFFSLSLFASAVLSLELGTLGKAPIRWLPACWKIFMSPTKLGAHAAGFPSRLTDKVASQQLCGRRRAARQLCWALESASERGGTHWRETHFCDPQLGGRWGLCGGGGCYLRWLWGATGQLWVGLGRQRKDEGRAWARGWG